MEWPRVSALACAPALPPKCARLVVWMNCKMVLPMRTKMKKPNSRGPTL